MTGKEDWEKKYREEIEEVNLRADMLCAWNDELENKLSKYERAFEILKDNFFIDLIERQDDWKLGFEPVNPIEGQPRFSQLPKEEAELLEELMKGETSI